MACNCKRGKKTRYEWVDDDGENRVVYNTEIEAKAKVLRKGGRYRALTPA